eukprot:515362-Lingulodinium_polyedra.AAC.1
MNCTVEQLEDYGVLGAFAGRTMRAVCAGCEATCSGGKGRRIDYAIGDRQARGILGELSLVPAVPWKVHRALQGEL